MKKLYTLFAFLLFTTILFAQGSWHVQAQFGGASRYRATSFVVNGKCYVGTGVTAGGMTNDQQDLWEYDPALNAWTQMADLTGPKRMNATGAADDNYGYIGLGSNNGVVLTDWWQYDPALNTWAQKTSFPGHSRYGAGSFTIQNRVYVGGGIDSNNVVYSDFYAYDGTNDVWAPKHSLPAAVTSMATFVISAKGYFVGGAINGSVSATTQNAEYDPIADAWTLRAPFDGGNIYSCVGFSLDSLGYVGTGFCGNLTTIMYRFDPVGNAWTQETDFPNGIRQWAVVCNVNNRAYVGTGNSTGGNLYNDWWEFVPVTTGLKSNVEKQFVSFDLSTHELNVSKAKGTEILRLFTSDGKLLSEYHLQQGNNTFYVNQNGVLLAQIIDSGKMSVTKFANVE